MTVTISRHNGAGPAITHVTACPIPGGGYEVVVGTAEKRPGVSPFAWDGRDAGLAIWRVDDPVNCTLVRLTPQTDAERTLTLRLIDRDKYETRLYLLPPPDHGQPVEWWTGATAPVGQRAWRGSSVY